jgi:hypothetical protein
VPSPVEDAEQTPREHGQEGRAPDPKTPALHRAPTLAGADGRAQSRTPAARSAVRTAL